MTIREFVNDHGGLSGSLNLAKNRRFSGMLRAICNPQATKGERAVLLTKGGACFKCQPCAFALVDILTELTKNIGQPLPKNVADKVARDKYGLGTVAFEVKVKKT